MLLNTKTQFPEGITRLSSARGKVSRNGQHATFKHNNSHQERRSTLEPFRITPCSAKNFIKTRCISKRLYIIGKQRNPSAFGMVSRKPPTQGHAINSDQRPHAAVGSAVPLARGGSNCAGTGSKTSKLDFAVQKCYVQLEIQKLQEMVDLLRN